MEETFAKFLKTKEITFKYAKGMRDIIGKEIHNYHEIFLFMGGDAEFISEDGKVRLSPFTTVIIPKDTFHQFVVTGPEYEYRRCVFNFESVLELDGMINRKLRKIALVRDDGINNIFAKLQNLCRHPLSKDENDILLKSLFAQILVALPSSGFCASEYSFFNSVTQNALEYINENLGGALSVHILSEKLHISPSHLAHIFKKDMHIPIHRYILQKRLILADRLIEGGKNPTTAAHECGFNDYSGFYRQYKNFFSVSPSKQKKAGCSTQK